MACWSTTIVLWATVNVETWTTAQTSVAVFIPTVMKTFSVFVTGKVATYMCTGVYRSLYGLQSILVYVPFKYKVFNSITGLLCGMCQHDKGVSVLLNNCKSCGAENILLIPALGKYCYEVSEKLRKESLGSSHEFYKKQILNYISCAIKFVDYSIRVLLPMLVFYML